MAKLRSSLAQEELDRLASFTEEQQQLFALLMNRMSYDLLIGGNLARTLFPGTTSFAEITTTAQSPGAASPAITRETLEAALELAQTLYDAALRQPDDPHYLVRCGAYAGIVQKVIQLSRQRIVIRTEEAEFEVIGSTDELQLYAVRMPPSVPPNNLRMIWESYQSDDGRDFLDHLRARINKNAMTDSDQGGEKGDDQNKDKDNHAR